MDSDPSTAAALGAARVLLHDAHADAAAVRLRADALANATDWRSRATDGYRAGVAALVDDLTRLVRLIHLADGEVAGALRDPVRAVILRAP